MSALLIRGIDNLLHSSNSGLFFFIAEENTTADIFNMLDLLSKYDIKVTVLGGGLVGQAGACQLGIARALEVMNEEYRKSLKSKGFLSRDPRVKERKKYGCKRARKGYQFRKR